jgi:hypothetical protein
MSRRKTTALRPNPQPAHEDPPSASAAHKPAVATAAVLFCVLFAVFLLNFRLVSSGDNIPTRLLPFSLVRERNVDLDEFGWLRWPAGGRLPYYVHERHGHLYSGTTIVTALVVAPLYIVPDRILRQWNIGYDDVRARLMIVVMERLSAAALVALSAALLYLLLNRLAPPGWALVLTLTYALGTNTWVVSSQGLWSHTLSELALVILSSVLLASDPSRPAMVFAGVTAAVGVANRPQLLPFALLAAFFVWRHQRRHLVAFLVVPVVAAALLAAYNLTLFRGLAGGYFGFAHFSTSLFSGVAGLLLSPNRGLLIFAPLTIFAFYGAIRVWREGWPLWLRYLAVGLGIHLILYGKFDNWWAGYTYGPRYMTDVLPVLTLLLVPGLVPLWQRRAVRLTAAVMMLYGVAVQCTGVYCDDDDWNRHPISIDVRPERVWDWTDWQVLRAARSGWKGFELVPLLKEAFSDPVPALLERMTPEDLAAEVRVLHAPVQLPPGGRGEAFVSVRNNAERAWPAFSGDIRVRYRVFLIVRWIARQRQVPGSGDVLPLPENVSPGETIGMKVPLLAPAVPAPYQVEMLIAQALDGARGVSSKDAVRVSVSVE